MALRSGYKGFKKLINGLKVLRPGVLGIDIGAGLAIGQDGKLNVTGVDVTVAGNPEEAATAGDLTKLQIGDDIFNVPDTTYSNATTTEAGLMSAADKEKLDGLDNGFTQLTSSDDLNDLTENGKRYYWNDATPINYAGDKYCKMFVFTVGDFCHQLIIRSNNQIFMRQFNGTAWQSWYKFEGIIVS